VVCVNGCKKNISMPLTEELRVHTLGKMRSTTSLVSNVAEAILVEKFQSLLAGRTNVYGNVLSVMMFVCFVCFLCLWMPHGVEWRWRVRDNAVWCIC
jgi:hypothetical protein